MKKNRVIRNIRNLFLRAFDRDGWFKGQDLRGFTNLLDNNERVSYDSAMSIATVYACVHVISQTLSTVPLILYQTTPNGGKKPAINEPEYYMLKSQANDWTTAASFWQEYIKSYLLRGNAYAWTPRQSRGPGAGSTSGLWFVHPDYVLPKRKGFQLYFNVSGSGETTLTNPIVDPVILMPGEIMYWANSAQNGVRGISVLEQQRHTFALARAQNKWQSALFRQGITPGAILESDDEIDEDEIKGIEEQWNKVHGGVENAGKAIVMPFGLKFRQVTMKASDVEIIEQYNLVERQIASAFRVPLPKLQNHEHSTFSNVEQLDLEFVKDCIRPLAEELEQIIEMQFLTESQRKRGLFCKFKLDAILRGSTVDRFTAYQLAINSGWMSRNEVRISEDLDPIDGLDDILVPLNMTPNGQNPTDSTKKRLLIVDARGLEKPRIEVIDGECRELEPAPQAIPEEKTTNSISINTEKAFRGILEKEFSHILTREREKVLGSARRLSAKEFEGWMNAFADRQEKNYVTQLEDVLTHVASGLGTDAPGTERIKADARSYKLRMQSTIRGLIQVSHGSWPMFLLKLEEHYSRYSDEASSYTESELQKLRGISDAA